MLDSVRSVAEVVRRLITTADRRRMVADVQKALDLIPDHVNRATVSEWAAERRILPQGLTPIPGAFRWEVCPYMREIADCFSEGSPVQKVAVMKGAQVTFTTAVLENVIGYVIDAAPGPTMYVGADKGSAETGIELRVDRMIESAGLAGKIFAQVEKIHNKKTGDTKAKKEFAGGYLLAVGPNTGAKLRSFPIKVLLLDEIDAYPQELGSQDATKGKTAAEGDPIALAEKRTASFSSARKILYGSTPLVEQSSKIKPLFQAGDQRYYYVPCKHCGHKQTLRWERLRYEKDERGKLVFDPGADGQPVPGTGHVWYECESCGLRWTNPDKVNFLRLGEWRPTAEASEPGFRSYHISALYAPVEMFPWEKAVLEWIAAQGDPTKLRTFFNTVLGETWVERGDAPVWERVALRHEDYHADSLPASARPLLVTVGADVQKDRIEAEIVAWGRNKESWSIAYLPLPGDTSDLDGVAWKALRQVVDGQHAGLPVMRALIDAGYNAPTVYQFCEGYIGGVLPVKGSITTIDERSLYAVRDVPGYQVRRVDLNTDKLKQEIYGYLVKGPPENRDGAWPSGYCHFPIDYDNHYYRMLTAEERVRERTKSGHYRMVWHLQHGRRNEALDARVYALGALYLIYGIRREEVQAEDAEAKRPLREYTWEDFWTELEDMKK